MNNELEDPLQGDNIQNEDKKLKCKEKCIKYKCKNICCYLGCILIIIFTNYISFCIGFIHKGMIDDDGSLSEFI